MDKNNSVYKIHYNNTEHLHEVCDLFNGLNVSRSRDFIKNENIEKFRKYGGFFDYFTLEEVDKYTRNNRHMISVTAEGHVCGALLISGNKEDIHTYFTDKNVPIINTVEQTSYGCIIGVKTRRNLIAKIMLEYAFKMFIEQGYIDFLIEVISIKSYEMEGLLTNIDVKNNASTQVSKWLDGQHIGKVFYKQYDFSDIKINTEYDIYSIDIQHCIDTIFNGDKQ